MSEGFPQASASGGKPSPLASQPVSSSNLPDSHQMPPSHNGIDPQQQDEGTSTQNNTSSGILPAQPTANTTHTTAHQDTIPPHGNSSLEANSVPNPVANQTDEKRDSTMPGARAQTASVSNLASQAIPAQVKPGGAPARVYLNEKVVPHLLDGMRSLAKEQPSDPLRVLGEFLLQKSNESGEKPGSLGNRDEPMSG